MRSWGLLTNHGLALVFLHRTPNARIREVAAAIGITERAAQRIVSELAKEGYLERTRTGRRNHYEIVRDAPLRTPVLPVRTVGRLVDGLTKQPAK